MASIPLGSEEARRRFLRKRDAMSCAVRLEARFKIVAPLLVQNTAVEKQLLRKTLTKWAVAQGFGKKTSENTISALMKANGLALRHRSGAKALGVAGRIEAPDSNYAKLRQAAPRRADGTLDFDSMTTRQRDAHNQLSAERSAAQRDEVRPRRAQRPPRGNPTGQVVLFKDGRKIIAPLAKLDELLTQGYEQRLTFAGQKHSEESRQRIADAQTRRHALARATPEVRAVMLKAEKDARREERAARPRAFQGRTHTAEAREKIRTAVIRRAALEKATPEERVVILTQEFEARLNKANRPIMPDYRGIAQRNKERAAQVEEEQASQQRAAKLALLHADWEANTQHALAEIDTEPRCTPNRVGPPPPNFIDLTDVAPEQMGKALTQHALGPMNGHYWSPQITYQRTYFLDRDTGEVVGVATYLANSVRKRVAHIGAFPGFTRGDTRGRQLVSFLRDGRFEPLATARLKTPINTRDNGTIIKFPTREKFEAEFATPAAAAMAERPTAAVHNPNSGPAAGAPDAPCYPSAIVTPPKPKRRFFPR